MVEMRFMLKVDMECKIFSVQFGIKSLKCFHHEKFLALSKHECMQINKSVDKSTKILNLIILATIFKI